MPTPVSTSSKIFSRWLGPTKNNDTLQPYVKHEFGKKVNVIIDCRTRWNSLVDIHARFLQLRGPVQKAQYQRLISATVSPADLTQTSLSSVKLSHT